MQSEIAAKGKIHPGYREQKKKRLALSFKDFYGGVKHFHASYGHFQSMRERF